MMKSIVGWVFWVFVVSIALCVIALVPTVEPPPTASPEVVALINGAMLSFNVLKAVAVAMWPVTVLVAFISGAILWLIRRSGGGGFL